MSAFVRYMVALRQHRRVAEEDRVHAAERAERRADLAELRAIASERELARAMRHFKIVMLLLPFLAGAVVVATVAVKAWLYSKGFLH